MNEHRDFWEATLPLWPRNSGKRANSDTLAWVVAWLRTRGHTDAAIASALGYPLDTLRRQRVLTVADEVRLDQAMGEVPLPWICSFDAGDTEPSRHGFINVRSDLRRFHERARARLRGEATPIAPAHSLDPPIEPGHSIHKNARHALKTLEK